MSNSQKTTEVASLSTQNKMICLDLLKQKEVRGRAQREGVEIAKRMRNDSLFRMNYGKDALDGVNGVANRISKEHRSVNIPEMTALMKQFDTDVRGLNKKYDTKTSGFLKRVFNGITGLWGGGKDIIQQIKSDIEPLDEKIDRLTSDLEKHRSQLQDNVVHYDHLQSAMVDEVGKLVYRIAVLESAHSEMIRMAELVQVGDEAMGDQGRQQKAEIMDNALGLERTISTYKSRLFHTWAMLPVLRGMRENQIGLARDIANLSDVAVPTIKQTFAAWLLNAQAHRAADFSDGVKDLVNATSQEFARAANSTTEAMAKAQERTMLTPETVTVITEQYIQSADKMLTAQQEGRKQRAELERAMSLAVKQISDKHDEVNRKMFEDLIANTGIELETYVPNVDAIESEGKPSVSPKESGVLDDG